MNKKYIAKGLLLASFICLMNKSLPDVEKPKDYSPEIFLKFSPKLDCPKKYFWEEQNWEIIYNRKPPKKIGNLEIIVEGINESQIKVLSTAEELMKSPIPKRVIQNCWTITNYIYDSANVDFSYAYSDEKGEKYIVDKHRIIIGDDKFIVPNPQQCSHELKRQNRKKISSEEKLNYLEVGDLIAYAHTHFIGHNAIFLGWKNKKEGIANLLDGRRNFKDKEWYQVYQINLKEHPIFMYWKPISK